MNIISWNCRGLGNARTVRALADLIKSHKPNILFLIETLAVEGTIKELSRRYGFDNYWSVDSVGRGGELALLWDHKVECLIVDVSSNFIDVLILNNNVHCWRLTGFYGFPDRARRRESWELIKTLSNKSSLPWCLMGDFNDMLSEGDKSGMHKHPQSLLDGFCSTIEECGLIELDLLGGKYTWENSRGKKEWVWEQLDRAFAVASWWQKFPLCMLKVHHTVYSDHDPVHLDLLSVDHLKKKFRFRFENTWLKEESFHEEVSGYWKNLPPTQFLPKLLDLSKFMEKWGRRFFNKFREKIRRQKEVLELYEACDNDSVTKRYFEEKKKLEELLIHEEAYWKQRAKSFWLLDGDSNSKFFHAFAITRKKKSSISQLKDVNQEYVLDHEGEQLPEAGMCGAHALYLVHLFFLELSVLHKLKEEPGWLRASLGGRSSGALSKGSPVGQRLSLEADQPSLANAYFAASFTRSAK
ncbi:uncharacterized protein LOC141679207 [Apium graveolens]|uniref:uncharacterized protein LOC141679207 n=1 Tax=Apium graveolens TaxID=4045 RepID=UPI003D791988